MKRMFNTLKQMHRIATRYYKTALSFMSFLSLAATFLPVAPDVINGAIGRRLADIQTQQLLISYPEGL